RSSTRAWRSSASRSPASASSRTRWRSACACRSGGPGLGPRPSNRLLLGIGSPPPERPMPGRRAGGYERGMGVAARPRGAPRAGEEVAYLGSEPARAARTAPLPDALHPRVRESLAALGIDALFTHQRDAWDAAAAGRHLIVTTGTASGKTLAFNLPVLDAL